MNTNNDPDSAGSERRQQLLFARLWRRYAGSAIGALRRSPALMALASFLHARAMFLLACGAMVIAYAGDVARPIDETLAALRFQTLSRAPTGELVVVEIDSHSLREAEEWPWPREHFARAISNLRAAGAGVIGFDVDFSARSSPGDDAALLAALEIDPGSVILPTFVQRSGEENMPLAALSADAVLGSVNIPIDADGRVRRYSRGFQHGERYVASMAAALAGTAYGDTGQFVIDYGVRTSDFEHLSFHDVFQGTFDPARVRGKTILVGATALELGDEFATPVSPTLPGVYVHALAYESLVQGRAFTKVRSEFVLALAFCALLWLWPRRTRLDLKNVLARHSAVLSTLLLGPTALQIAAPVSADMGLILLVQCICVVVSVRRELEHRAAELTRQREAHLTFVALHDPETELPNRRAMLQELSRRLDAQSSNGQGFVVAIAVGIERFSTLRGAVGYANANILVQSLSSRMQEWSGQADVFHISTSILGVVLTAASAAEAHRLCVDGVDRLNATASLNGQDVDINARTGAAIGEAGSATPETLLERATLALDQARLKNRRLVRYGDEDIGDPQVQLALMSGVGRGLARSEFALLYQAKTAIRGGEVTGAEALMRWRHPVHGTISPDRFIRVAEETGAIDELTRWALQKVVADDVALRGRGVSVVLSVNISGRSLSDPEFCQFAIDIVRASGARVCFEVTETAIISDPTAAMSSLSAFHKAGIRISIDDYGSGLSSLSYLKQIVADEIKLDKSLLGDLTAGSRDRLILKSTIDLAHGLGMSVVAEGVEDEITFAALSAIGCDSVQGYFVSRPASLEHLVQFCRSRRATDAQSLPAFQS